HPDHDDAGHHHTALFVLHPPREIGGLRTSRRTDAAGPDPRPLVPLRLGPGSERLEELSGRSHRRTTDDTENIPASPPTHRGPRPAHRSAFPRALDEPGRP